MKHLITLTCLFFAVSLNAQKITKSELINTEWFTDNSDTLFDMYSINLNPGDTVQFIQRVNTDLMENSPLFRKQELATLTHSDYGNFEFEKDQLVYYVSDKETAFQTIVGQMPIWTWKLKHKNELYLSKSGKFQVSLLLIKEEHKSVILDREAEEVTVLTFVRKK